MVPPAAGVGLRESKTSGSMSLPLWSVEPLWVGTDVDGLLDAPQSPILLLLYHFHIIPLYHMVVQGGCMFSESRLIVNVWGFLPLGEEGSTERKVVQRGR